MIGKSTVLRVWMGVDPREARAARVAQASFEKHRSQPCGLSWLDMLYLQQARYYTRKVEDRDGRLWDPVSQSPMSTTHAIARFLVPWMSCHVGWALFTDCDVMWRADPRELFMEANLPGNTDKAVLCVQHRQPETGSEKMDGQQQRPYARKNWSSVMLINCGHPSVKALTLDHVNEKPGLWLHGFEWLKDSEIGALPPEWNHLVGVDKHDPAAKLVHFTLGTPDLPGGAPPALPNFHAQPFAEEWRSYLMPAGGKEGAHGHGG